MVAINTIAKPIENSLKIVLDLTLRTVGFVNLAGNETFINFYYCVDLLEEDFDTNDKRIFVTQSL